MKPILLILAALILGVSLAGCAGPYYGSYGGYVYQPAPLDYPYYWPYVSGGSYFDHSFSEHRQVYGHRPYFGHEYERHRGHGTHFDHHWADRPHRRSPPVTHRPRRFDHDGDRQMITGQNTHDQHQAFKGDRRVPPEHQERQEQGHRFEAGHHRGGDRIHNAPTRLGGNLHCRGRHC